VARSIRYTPAQVVVGTLGQRALARELGIPQSTVWRWTKTPHGLVPSQHHRRILKLARGAISADDLVHGRRAAPRRLVA
jgi:hypothetical protein